MFSESYDSDEVVRETPCSKRLVEQIRVMRYQLNSGFMAEYLYDEHCKLKWREALLVGAAENDDAREAGR